MKASVIQKKGMTTAGVDVGAATTKTVILGTGGILSFSVIPTGSNVVKAAETATKTALQSSNLSMDDLQYVVSTGYGRRAVSFANHTFTEIICHAAGVHSVIPGARTIIDIGGQDSKVVELDGKGNVVNFVMNDKCAAGTGRFLEVMSKVLDVDIGEMGEVSLRGKDPCRISSTCTVFAESEMISLRAEGKSCENLLAGINKAMAYRVAIMGKSVGFRKDIVFTGGVAKNVGMKSALEEAIDSEILVPEEPQIMGAMGAAILAAAELSKREPV